MAKGKAEVEKRAVSIGFAVLKASKVKCRSCGSPLSEADIKESEGDVPGCWGCREVGHPDMKWAMEKGKFRGYSKNPLEGRAERQGKRRVWGKSRKNQSKRTAASYKRSKIRGSGSGARPAMRRQLGAGGERPSRKR